MYHYFPQVRYSYYPGKTSIIEYTSLIFNETLTPQYPSILKCAPISIPAGTNNLRRTHKPDNPLKEIRNPIPRNMDNPIKGIRYLVQNGIRCQCSLGLIFPT